MKILLIDDNSTISMIVKALLQKYAYIKEEDEIINYCSTLIEKDELKSILLSCEIIICDFDLGGDNPNGIEFFNSIEQDSQDIKKVLLTANNSFILKSIMEMKTNIDYIIKEELNSSSWDEGIHKLGNIIKSIKNT